MKIERKYMAHYLNANFANDDGTAGYVRLGQDLEEYNKPVIRFIFSGMSP